MIVKSSNWKEIFVKCAGIHSGAVRRSSMFQIIYRTYLYQRRLQLDSCVRLLFFVQYSVLLLPMPAPFDQEKHTRCDQSEATNYS